MTAQRPGSEIEIPAVVIAQRPGSEIEIPAVVTAQRPGSNVFFLHHSAGCFLTSGADFLPVDAFSVFVHADSPALSQTRCRRPRDRAPIFTIYRLMRDGGDAERQGGAGLPPWPPCVDFSRIWSDLSTQFIV